ncbi:hypothetical protein OG749_34290 [Streptomyces nojiriensis]|uniref:hypothetical protein n=1 Tax=Streptomyces nojiriensis TaxID=66374 RepID=UPI002E175A10
MQFRTVRRLAAAVAWGALAVAAAGCGQGASTASQAAYRRTGDDPIGPGTPAVVINSRMVPEAFRGFLFEEQLAEDLLNIVRIDPVGRQDHHA